MFPLLLLSPQFGYFCTRSHITKISCRAVLFMVSFTNSNDILIFNIGVFCNQYSPWLLYVPIFTLAIYCYSIWYWIFKTNDKNYFIIISIICLVSAIYTPLYISRNWKIEETYLNRDIFKYQSELKMQFHKMRNA